MLIDPILFSYHLFVTASANALQKQTPIPRNGSLKDFEDFTVTVGASLSTEGTKQP